MEQDKNLQEIIQQLQHKVKQYQEDRFCQGGCCVYQYDKINKYKEYFSNIKENAIQIKSFLYALDKDSITIQLIQTIQDICDCALDGTKW